MSVFKSFTSLCRNCVSKLNFSSKNEQKESVVETKEPIKISITKTDYTFAHGKKFKKQPTWLVVHYTGVANVSAKQMCKSMRNNQSASSHFYVDEKSIYASVPLEYIAWHVGTGQVSQPDASKKRSLEQLAEYKSNSWRYDYAAKNHLEWKANGEDFTGNSVSIGVDLCVKKTSTKTTKATDSDWYFEEAALDNAAKLIAFLCDKYQIEDSHIITHCAATGKICPAPLVWPDESKWLEFKSRINEYRNNEFQVVGL